MYRQQISEIIDKSEMIKRFFNKSLLLYDLKDVDINQFSKVFSELYPEHKDELIYLKPQLTEGKSLYASNDNRYFSISNKDMITIDYLPLQKFLNIYLEIQTENIDEIQILEF